MGHMVNIGETVQAQLSYQHLKLLSRDLGDGKKSCINTGFDECMYGRLLKLMKERAGCRTPWIVKSDVPICTEAEAVNETYWLQFDKITNQDRDCQLPCESIEIGLSGKNTYSISGNYSQVYLYFAPMVMNSEEHWLYTSLSLFAEIGGYLGLLMGYSILNLAYFAGNVIDKRLHELEHQLH